MTAGACTSCHAVSLYYNSTQLVSVMHAVSLCYNNMQLVSVITAH